MRFLPLSVLLTATLLVPARPAAAQAVTPISLRASTTQFAATAALMPHASIAREQPAVMVNVAPEHGTRHEGWVLMIVGLAGIVTGLVVDEPVVTLLGAVAGGVGLYFYLR